MSAQHAARYKACWGLLQTYMVQYQQLTSMGFTAWRIPIFLLFTFPDCFPDIHLALRQARQTTTGPAMNAQVVAHPLQYLN